VEHDASVEDDALDAAEHVTLAAFEGLGAGLAPDDAAELLELGVGGRPLATASALRYTASALRLLSVTLGGALSASVWQDLFHTTMGVPSEHVAAVEALFRAVAAEAGGIQFTDLASLPLAVDDVLPLTMRLAALILAMLGQVGVDTRTALAACRQLTHERRTPAARNLRDLAALLSHPSAAA
jgi:hypothetical protein